MVDLQKISNNATHLDALKQLVNTHLTSISQQIQSHNRQERKERETFQVDLHSLTQKVREMESESTELKIKLEIAQQNATRDPLTRLPNRLAFEERMTSEVARWHRNGLPLTMLIWDIDFFKRINDTYGHKTGDKALVIIAQILEEHCRKSDFVARFGGEEFAVVLPNCHAFYGGTIAERIRQTLQDMAVTIGIGIEIHISVSIGGAYAPEWVRSTAALWIERADVQLYRAKNEGRNRVFLDSQQEIFVSAEEKNMLFGHLALGDPAWIEGATGDTAANTVAQRIN
jgi:diguanylate cyclase